MRDDRKSEELDIAMVALGLVYAASLILIILGLAFGIA